VKNRQVEIEWVNQSASSELECDVQRIDRVFTNLLLNAINHSPPHRKVIVRLSEQVSQYLVEIIDRRRGIKPADMPHIFVKFYRGTIGRRSKGAGLGLYLARQIVETHGGTIWEESGLDIGTDFLFTLPKTSALA
jgi:two-component system, NarL family, sensor kinase